MHFVNEDAARSIIAAVAAKPARTDEDRPDDGATSSVVVRGRSADFARAAELEQLGDSIAELAAHLHAATYRLLVMLAEFDRRGGWGGGFRSCAHWLSWRTRINLGAAREKVRVARALERLPDVSDALRCGELSYAVVRAVTRIATPENERELLELARHGTASHVERVVRAWRRVDRLEEQFLERERHRSRYHPDDDGMYVLRGRISPEVGALLDRALAAASEALYEAPNQGQPASPDATSYRQRQADAIGLLAEWALGGGPVSAGQPEKEVVASDDEPDEVAQRTEEAVAQTQNEATAYGVGDGVAVNEATARDVVGDGAAVNEATAREVRDRASVEAVNPSPRPRPVTIGRAERFQVVVHVDAAALRAGSDSGQAVLAGGIRVSPETCRRMACDASRVLMIHDTDGTVLDVGRRTRIVPVAIRRVLDYRDRGCRFPGCGLRICDAHHIKDWIDGGSPKLTNLALLCRRHHRAVHEDGFRMQLEASGDISFMRPDGRPLPYVPPSPRLPEDCVAQLVASQQEMGLEINAWTPTPPWHGERLDLDFAIRALRAVRG